MTDAHAHDTGCSEYNELSRRQFVAGAAWGASAAALAAAFPAWLPRVVLAESFVAQRDVIVSVFLRGGADGLSLCVPFFEGANYYDVRPNIAVPEPSSGKPNRAVNLDGKFGLPPAMAALAPAYQQGDLLVIHGAGLTTSTRSHFDAQRYIEVGKAQDPRIITGWLGRHLASSTPTRTGAPLRALGLADGLQRTLYGAPHALPIADPPNFAIGGAAATATARREWLTGDYSLSIEPLRSAALDVTNTLTLLKTIDFTAYKPAGGAAYPTSFFGRSLRSAAALIKSDVGVEAIQVDIGGWDTHQNQDPLAGSMSRTMADFANSIGAFYADVMASNANASVTLVAISEFGRNVRENGSLGTDHGRASAMFALGRGIAGGRVLTSNWGGLARANLESGQDLKVTIDHRDVLSEVVKNRLGNSNLSYIFPDYAPTVRGVTK